MAKFPVDAPKLKAIKVLESLGFRIIREKEHISMIRDNSEVLRKHIRDGTVDICYGDRTI
jgi:hypothetical protein